MIRQSKRVPGTAPCYGTKVILATLLSMAFGFVLASFETGRFKIEQPNAYIWTTVANKTEIGHLGEQGATRTRAELLRPNLKISPPNNLYVVGSRITGTLRLKFGTMIWNAGEGPLETRGATNSTTGKREVHQFFRTAGGKVTRGPRIGTFNYNHRHGHLHLEAFARYELWSLGESGRTLERVTLNTKVGFCLMDNKAVDTDLRNAARAPIYSGCRADIQGISVGYGDEYVAQLLEQDLDITNLPDGNYTLMTTANPDSRLVETNYADNTASIHIQLKEGSVDIIASRDGSVKTQLPK